MSKTIRICALTAITFGSLVLLCQPSTVQGEAPKYHEDYLAKLDLFAGLPSPEEDPAVSIGGVSSFTQYLQLGIEEAKKNEFELVKQKSWDQAVYDPSRVRVGSNQVSYRLFRAKSLSPSELKAFVKALFGPGADSFASRSLKRWAVHNQQVFADLPNRTETGRGGGRKAGRTWSGINIASKTYLDVAFDAAQQVMRGKESASIYRETLRVGPEPEKKEVRTFTPTKERALLHNWRVMAVAHGPYVMLANVSASEAVTEHRMVKDESNWTQSIKPPHAFPEDLWATVTQALSPFLDNPPLPGQIMGGTVEPTIPPDEPITGIHIHEVVKDSPHLQEFRVMWPRGDVQIDYGESGKKPLKHWDIVHVGDTIVTGAGSWVTLDADGYNGTLHIGRNSRVKIIKKSQSAIWAARWENEKRIAKAIIDNFNWAYNTDEGRPFFCLDEGSYYVNDFPVDGVMVDFLKYFLTPGHKHVDEEIITYQVPPYQSALYTVDRDTVYKLTHDKSNGRKSVAVVEGEVLAVCDQQPETVWSIKAGEQLTVDNDCSGQKTQLSTSEIEQIISLFPDAESETRLTANADAYVYAYAYRNWDKCNFGAYNNLQAGWHPTGGEKRAYLKFDLAGVDPDRFERAALKLFHCSTVGNPSLPLEIHAVTGAWREGGGTYHSGRTEEPAAPGEITWVAQPPSDESPGTLFSPGAGINKYVEVDVTDLVKGWLSGKPNHGLVITGSPPLRQGTPESSYSFFSREHEDNARRPVLIVQSAREMNIGAESEGIHKVSGLYTDKNGHHVLIAQDGDKITAEAVENKGPVGWKKANGRVKDGNVSLTINSRVESAKLSPEGKQILWGSGSVWSLINPSATAQKTFTLTSDALALEDATVYADNWGNLRNSNWGGAPQLFVGSRVRGFADRQRRTYMKFDAEEVARKWDTLVSAKLLLYDGSNALTKEYEPSAVDVLVYRVTGPWIEGTGGKIKGTPKPPFPDGGKTLCWRNQPGYDKSKVWVRKQLRGRPAKGAWIEFDITELVRGWVTEKYPNHGLVFVLEGEGAKRSTHWFTSSEWETKGFRPKIEVIKTSK